MPSSQLLAPAAPVISAGTDSPAWPKLPVPGTSPGLAASRHPSPGTQQAARSSTSPAAFPDSSDPGFIGSRRSIPPSGRPPRPFPALPRSPAPLSRHRRRCGGQGTVTTARGARQGRVPKGTRPIPHSERMGSGAEGLNQEQTQHPQGSSGRLGMEMRLRCHEGNLQSEGGFSPIPSLSPGLGLCTAPQ